MPDDMVYEFATLKDFDGVRLAVGVDYSTVTINLAGHTLARLDQAQRGQLAGFLAGAGALADCCPDEPDPFDDEPAP